MPTAPKTPPAKSVPAPAPVEAKGAPPAPKKPTNPFVDKHPGKPGRNASGQAHRRAR